MQFSHYFTYIQLLLFISCSLFLNDTQAKPTLSFVDGYVDSIESAAEPYYASYTPQLTETRLHRLRRGYYYIEDGYITAVPVPALPANRRQDTPISDKSDTNYDTLKYRPTHAKRKKLFVPNLFG